MPRGYSFESLSVASDRAESDERISHAHDNQSLPAGVPNYLQDADSDYSNTVSESATASESSLPAVDATTMSLGPGAARMLSDDELTSQAAALRGQLGRTDGLDSAMRDTAVKNLAGLEWEAHERAVWTTPAMGAHVGLPTAGRLAAGFGGPRLAEAVRNAEALAIPDGTVIPLNPGVLRYHLEQLIARKGQHEPWGYWWRVMLYRASLQRELEGSPVMAAAAMEVLSRISRAADQIREQSALLRLENEEFRRSFGSRGSEVMRALLLASEARVVSELARYGIDWNADLETRIAPFLRTDPSNPFGLLEASLDQALTPILVPFLQPEATMHANQDTEALFQAARELADSGDQLLAQRSAYNYESELVEKELHQIDAFGGPVYRRWVRMEEPLKEATRAHQQLWLDRQREFPILAAFRSRRTDLRTIARGQGAGAAIELAKEILATLASIKKARFGLENGKYSVWDLPRIVSMTKLDMQVVPWSMRDRIVRDKVRDENRTAWWEYALVAVGVALAVLTAVPSGGSSLVLGLEVAGLALDAYLLHDTLETYGYGKAAAGTDFDPALSISAADPSLGWVVIELLASGVGARGVVSAFQDAMALRRAVRTGRGIDETRLLQQHLDDFGDTHGSPNLGSRVYEQAASEPPTHPRAAEGGGGRLAKVETVEDVEQLRAQRPVPHRPPFEFDDLDTNTRATFQKHWEEYCDYYDNRLREIELDLSRGKTPVREPPLDYDHHFHWVGPGSRTGRGRYFQDAVADDMISEADFLTEKNVGTSRVDKPSKGDVKFPDQLILDRDELARFEMGRVPSDQLNVVATSNKSRAFDELVGEGMTPDQHALKTRVVKDVEEVFDKYAGELYVRRKAHPLFGQKINVREAVLVYDISTVSSPWLRRFIKSTALAKANELSKAEDLNLAFWVTFQ